MNGWQDGAVIDGGADDDGPESDPEATPDPDGDPPPDVSDQPYPADGGYVPNPAQSATAWKIYKAGGFDPSAAPGSFSRPLFAVPGRPADAGAYIIDAVGNRRAAGGDNDGAGQTSAAPVEPSGPSPALSGGAWQEGAVLGDTPGMAQVKVDAANLVHNSSTPWMRAINNGFTFGMADRLDAGWAAAMTAAHDAGSGLLGLPAPAYTPGEAYQAVLNADRGGERQFAIRHPWIDGGLGVLGMAANPIADAAGAYVAGADALWPAMGRGALANGLLGGAFGAGTAPQGEELSGGAHGAGLGVLSGPVAPLAGAMLGPVQDYLAVNAPKLAAAIPKALGSAVQRPLDGAGEAPAASDGFSAALAPESEADDAAPGGTSVIGHFPAYIDLAKELGADYFSLPDNQWNWPANQDFLDQAIGRGDTFRLATPIEKVRPGSITDREIKYLQDAGYRLNAAGDALIPAGGD